MFNIFKEIKEENENMSKEQETIKSDLTWNIWKSTKWNVWKLKEKNDWNLEFNEIIALK